MIFYPGKFVRWNFSRSEAQNVALARSECDSHAWNRGKLYNVYPVSTHLSTYRSNDGPLSGIRMCLHVNAVRRILQFFISSMHLGRAPFNKFKFVFVCVFILCEYHMDRCHFSLQFTHFDCYLFPPSSIFKCTKILIFLLHVRDKTFCLFFFFSKLFFSAECMNKDRPHMGNLGENCPLHICIR